LAGVLSEFGQNLDKAFGDCFSVRLSLPLGIRSWGLFAQEGNELQTNDEHFMGLALSIAKIASGQSSPNPPVGAVVVNDGRIVGQGVHLTAGGPHAEVHALNMAGSEAEGGTIYVTLEPCNHHGRTPPCTEAILKAGIRRVVVGSADPNPHVTGHGLQRLRDAGLQVTVGVLKSEADKMNEIFLHYVMKSRPFVVWKCAATLDGYIATKSGHSQYVTGEVARGEVQALRRGLSGIAVGIGTVLADDPRLTVRDSDGPVQAKGQPKRIVFDSKLRIPRAARLLYEPGETLIVTTNEAVQSEPGKMSILACIPGVTVLPVRSGNGRISLSEALVEISNQGVMSILLEGGSSLASACFREQLIDKIVYYIAPKFLGGGIPALFGNTTESMANAVSLRDVNYRQVGEDLCIEGYPLYEEADRHCSQDS
jgi:diaminohydroxyphosphoribosylaminopyrimidine deaminase / 5-amino-6-(5-phosphoribosylamino)uracil reductase